MSDTITRTATVTIAAEFHLAWHIVVRCAKQPTRIAWQSIPFGRAEAESRAATMNTRGEQFRDWSCC